MITYLEFFTSDLCDILVLDDRKEVIIIHKSPETKYEEPPIMKSSKCCLYLDYSSAKKKNASLYGDAELWINKLEKKIEKNTKFDQTELPFNFGEFFTKVAITYETLDWDLSENQYDEWQKILDCFGKGLKPEMAELKGKPKNAIKIIDDGNSIVILACDEENNFYMFDFRTS